MTGNPLVSIIINCFNGEKFLREAIDSVIAQTYQNWEIIFWDNQSTDKTSQLVSLYQDGRIRYYYASEHKMLGESRNDAISKTKGEYLTFLDYDDAWLSTYLEKMVDVLTREGENCAFVYCNYYNWLDGEKLVINNGNISSCVKTFEDLLSNYNVGMSAVMVNARIMKENNIRFNKRYQLIEDYDFFLKLSYHNNAYYLSEPLMKYRMHGGSLTSTMKKNWGTEFRFLYDELTQKWLTEGEKNIYKGALDWLKVRIVRSEIEKNVSEGHRWTAMMMLIKNLYLSPKIIIMIASILLPEKTFVRIMHILRRRAYYC